MAELLSRLEKQGKLRKQKAAFAQIEALLREAILDIEEARKILKIAERATCILAYNAMLKAGRALLLLNGYITSDGGQHKTVVDVTGFFMGEKFQDLTLHFDRMRRKRNEMTYEAGGLISLSESQKAFDGAIALVQNILSEVKRQNPQLKLKLTL